MKETDLYQPTKTLLEDLGYTIKGEVGSADVMGMKDGHVIIVELKLNISLKLIYQAIERQKVADKVYVCLPKKVLNAQKSNVKHFILLLKRLEIGLIAVSTDKAEVLVETFGFDLKRSVSSSKKKRDRLTKEFSLRIDTSTEGGSKGERLTHYKEKVIIILKHLGEVGQSSPKDIKAATSILDTPNILRKNYYKWFSNPSRGIYELSEIGLEAFETYKV